MFKKILALTLCALMLLTSAMAMAESWTAPEVGSPLDEYNDLGLFVGDHWYPIMFPFAYVEELPEVTGLQDAMGEPLDVLASPSCAFKGEDVEFQYDGISIYTNPLGDYDIWMEAHITGGDWTTARGIGIGATVDEITAAYGEGFADGEDIITYNVANDPYDTGSPNVQFILEDGVVIEFDIYYPTNNL